MSDNSIKEIQRAMKAIWASGGSSFPDPKECTAELLDEEDENGIVVIKNKHGAPIVYMSRSDYEQIRKDFE